MKKSSYCRFYSFLLAFIPFQVCAEPIITFFFKPAPDVEAFSQHLKHPGKLAKYAAHNTFASSFVEGIVVAYAGYVTSSDYNGEITFPRKHAKTLTHILITPHITPIALFENTLLHWKRVPGVPAVLYSCEQGYDEKTKTHFWQTEEVALSEDMSIPLGAIIIVEKPTVIMMNKEKTITHESANLVLPDIYVKEGKNIIEDSLYMLTIRQFFRPVQAAENREPLKIITHVRE